MCKNHGLTWEWVVDKLGMIWALTEEIWIEN
jgi:hypothetical protein